MFIIVEKETGEDLEEGPFVSIQQAKDFLNAEVFKPENYRIIKYPSPNLPHRSPGDRIDLEGDAKTFSSFFPPVDKFRGMLYALESIWMKKQAARDRSDSVRAAGNNSRIKRIPHPYDGRKNLYGVYFN